MYKEKQYEVSQFRHERDSRLIGDMMQNEAAEKIFAWAGKEGLEDIYRGMYEMSCITLDRVLICRKSQGWQNGPAVCSGLGRFQGFICAGDMSRP